MTAGKRSSLHAISARVKSIRANIDPLLIHGKVWMAGELSLATLLVVGLGFLPAASRSILPILLFAGLSLWCRQLRIAEIGLGKPSSWPKVILTGLVLGAAIALLGNLVILPLIRRWSGLKTVSPGVLPAMGNNLGLLVVLIASNWILAAGAEEFVFRGYFLNRFLDLAGPARIGMVASIVGSALLFSAGHGFSNVWYALSTLFTGLIYGLVYLSSGRNLWPTIIAHGIANTLGISMAFLGII
jgi:membrane protease YdiL (CAAX protease family)